MSVTSAIASRRWDAERFGLTPAGLLARVRPPDAPRVVSISIPKAGTHLVERALCLHPSLHRRFERTIYPAQLERLERLLAAQRPGEVICGHLHHRPETVALLDAAAPSVVFVVRDPRDVVVSQAHWVAEQRGHQWHEAAARRDSLRERVLLFVEGDEAAGVRSIGGVLELYAGWLERPGVELVRYEELVDPERRWAALTGLFTRLGIDAGVGLVERIGERLVSSASTTFRRGSWGEWREVFDDEIEAAFERSAGSLPELFGYRRPAP